MTEGENAFMEAAVDAARKSREDRTGRIPRVGAVVVADNRIIGIAFRGQYQGHPNDHAEYNLLDADDSVLKDFPLVDATIYTTLEPCTHRSPEKTACVDRLIKRKVGRVVVGMLDPNPIVRGLGMRKLRQANIPTEMFPHRYMSQLEELNRFFISHIESHPIHQMTQDIGVLAARCSDPRRSAAAEENLRACWQNLRKIDSGEIPLVGHEAEFFRHWLARASIYDKPQTVRAYIRLPAFKPEDLNTKNWFQEFYERLSEMVHSGKITIYYIYLIPTEQLTEPTKVYLERIQAFAEEIRIISLAAPLLKPEDLRPSIVLFETQKFAFTHDRADTSAMLQATEWISKEHYERLERQYQELRPASEPFYKRT